MDIREPPDSGGRSKPSSSREECAKSQREGAYAGFTLRRMIDFGEALSDKVQILDCWTAPRGFRNCSNPNRSCGATVYARAYKTRAGAARTTTKHTTHRYSTHRASPTSLLAAASVTGAMRIIRGFSWFAFGL